MTTKAKVTKDGLLIPRQVAERALGEGSEEVEIFEEPGKLLITPTAKTPGEDRKPLAERLNEAYGDHDLT